MQEFPGISFKGELNCSNKQFQTLSLYVKQILPSSPLAPGGCQRAAEVWCSACLRGDAVLPSLSDRPARVSPCLLDTGHTTADTPDPGTGPLPWTPTSRTESNPNHDPLQPPATQETLQRDTQTDRHNDYLTLMQWKAYWITAEKPLNKLWIRPRFYIIIIYYITLLY